VNVKRNRKRRPARRAAAETRRLLLEVAADGERRRAGRPAGVAVAHLRPGAPSPSPRPAEKRQPPPPCGTTPMFGASGSSHKDIGRAHKSQPMHQSSMTICRLSPRWDGADGTAAHAHRVEARTAGQRHEKLAEPRPFEEQPAAAVVVLLTQARTHSSQRVQRSRSISISFCPWTSPKRPNALRPLRRRSGRNRPALSASVRPNAAAGR